MVPKLRSRGYIPFFVTERKRSEAALIQVIQEAFVQGVSTRKMEKLAHSLGIENLSRSQVSEMTKGLNEQVQDFRSRSLTGHYPVIWTDALYEKVRVDGRVVSMYCTGVGKSILAFLPPHVAQYISIKMSIMTKLMRILDKKKRMG